MKKNLILSFFTVVTLLISINSVGAREYLKNFYAYDVKNVNIREFSVEAKRSVAAYNGPDKGELLKGVQNAIIYTGKDYTYFIKLYPANHNTHIFVVANEKYDVKNNDVTQFLQQKGYQYSKLEDKDAFKEYQQDFYILARTQQLGNFYISPDLIKPLKTGMSKLNNHFAKNNKKTSVIPYSIDYEPIKLTCIDTTGCYDENAKIAILQREYRLTQKSNKFVHAHEYIVTNKNDSTASVSVSSERLAGLKDVATEAFVDLDRMDLIDTVGSFPPVLICTAGVSILCSVPNWIRMARITKEATRYSHALPENYQLRSQGQMRILVLKYKKNPKPLNFNVKFENRTYNIVF